MDLNGILNIEANIYALLSFGIYLLIIIGLGLYARRFSSLGVSNFFIGGRKMNRFVVALSAVVSGRSSWLLLGVTGMAYSLGLSAIWAVLGYTVVEFLLFIFYAPRLRRFSERHDCITVPDYFAERFNDHNGRLRLVIALVILLFMISYVSAQLVGGGKVFAAGFGIDPSTGIIITALIVLIYTVLGGFLAVSLTDVVQAFFMIFALLLLPAFAIFDTGGISHVVSVLTTQNSDFLNPSALGFGVAIGFLGIGLGSPGNPHIIARYMSIDDPKQLKYSAVVGTVWNILMGSGAVLIGLVGRVYFPDLEMLPMADTENLFPALAQQQLHPILFGLIVASIFAAIMSTADSQLLVGASAMVRDIYEKVVKDGQAIAQKKLVLYSRLSILVLTILALLLGFLASDLVFWLVLFAWAGLGAALGPTSILALFWKKTTRAGIFSGVISGTLVTIIWRSIDTLKEQMYELIPAFLISFLLTFLVSLWTCDEKTIR